MRIDNAMGQYLTRLLGPKAMQTFRITVIDQKDLNSMGLTEEMAKDYIKKSQAKVIVVMEGDQRTASFTVVKDSRLDEQPRSPEIRLAPRPNRDRGSPRSP